ncbi:MAG TPA: hypothetical protein VK595_00625 [Vicinamibacterales bacterium]|nr:hypothetical protein [Vicinamibacterales bacterium]
MPTFEDLLQGDEQEPRNDGEVLSPAPALERDAGQLQRSKMRSPGKDVLEGVPIAGVTGVNGAGKTLLAANCAIARMARGETVYSSVPIVSQWGNSLPIKSMRQLLHLRDATILLDEVSVIFSSRSSQSLPADIVGLLQTLRHKNLRVIWTAPSWMRCDNLLREVTQGVVSVLPLLRHTDARNPWPRPRLMLASLLDTSTGKTDAVPDKVLRRRLFVPRRMAAFGTYDTHADTPLFGRYLQGGKCVDCGGTQETPKHTPERHAKLGIPWYDNDAHSPAHAD